LAVTNFVGDIVPIQYVLTDDYASKFVCFFIIFFIIIKNKNKKTNTKNKTISSSKSCVVFTKNEENIVVDIIKNMVKCEFKLYQMTEKCRKTNPPAPFTTSTLQQTASQRLGMDAKRTMNVAQKLYEGGYITYMRTDSTAICEEETKKIKEEIINKYGIEYYEYKEYKNKKSNTQEAHECVRPTKIQYDTIEGTSDEKRLYSIIWKRTIQSQMSASQYQNITIEIEMLKRKLLTSYKLVGNLENLIFLGYLIVDDKKTTSSLNIEMLKKLLIDWVEINGNGDTQKPPNRYNDAGLINKLDPKNLNIGRPSTYASIIDTIISRKYVEIKDIEGKQLELNKYNITKKDPKNLTLENKIVTIGKEKKKLVPTELGKIVTDFLEKYFSKLMDYGFTAGMERQLDDVAEGQIDKKEVIKPFYDYVQEQIKTIQTMKGEHKIGVKYNPSKNIGKYKNIDVMLNDGPYGQYISCDKYKFNLKTLFEQSTKKKETTLDEDLENYAGSVNNNKISNDSDEYNSDLEYIGIEQKHVELDLSKLTNEEILKKVIEKISFLKASVEKEWKIGKKKYILKNGQYGYFVEEWNITSNKKLGNFNIKFLMQKIAKYNKLDVVESIDKVIELITNKDIEETVEYFSKNKKNTNFSKK
jgi:DNA topoisomerase-1